MFVRRSDPAFFEARSKAIRAFTATTAGLDMKTREEGIATLEGMVYVTTGWFLKISGLPEKDIAAVANNILEAFHVWEREAKKESGGP